MPASVRAVDDVSFDVRAGERLGVVGESGSGKTTTALALMRMMRPPGRSEGGSAIVDGTDLMALPPTAMREARLRTIAYIPQGAMNSLNPVMRIGAQMRERDGRPWRAGRGRCRARCTRRSPAVDLDAARAAAVSARAVAAA